MSPPGQERLSSPRNRENVAGPLALRKKTAFISLICLIFLPTDVAEKWRPSTLRWTPHAVGGESGLRAAPHYAAALLLPV